MPEHKETTPNTSESQEVSLVHIAQHEPFSALPMEKMLPGANQTEIQASTHLRTKQTSTGTQIIRNRKRTQPEKCVYG